MLTYEAIEVHLASLREGQEELREDVRELRADNRSLRDKVDAVDTKLTQKIERVDANLSEKITQLSDAVAGMRGLQQATLWVMGILGSFGTVGKVLHWF